MALSRRTLAGTTPLLVLAFLAAGAYLRARGEDGRAADEDRRPAESPAVAFGEGLSPSAGEPFSTEVAQPVRGSPVIRDTLRVSVTAAGRAEADRRAVMKARVEGTVRRVGVRENQRIAAGDLLIRVDTTQLALAAAKARADLRRAEAEFRELVLFDEEIEDPEVRARRERYARPRSGLDQAEVILREAELDLERATVRAPFPGRTADLRVVEGQHVVPGEELVTIVDLDPIGVEARALEAELGHLAEGRGASARFTAFPGEIFGGRIETINPVVDPGTGTARVRLSLPNPRGRIKPGMHARVALEARRFPDRILVPRAAILERERRAVLFVFVPDEPGSDRGRGVWRHVTTGLESDSLVEIVTGEETDTVEPGETVLVDGHHYLIHDARVRLLRPPGDGGGRPGG